MTVSSTADFYLASTPEIYPPKPKDAPIPILGKSPDRPYKVIGRLRFEASRGWRFMRESMLYNARQNGADAVILRDSTARQQMYFTEVPPMVDWVSVPGPVVVQKVGKKTYYSSYPNYVPIYQPGYTRRWVEQIVGIDAEMIVFRR